MTQLVQNPWVGFAGMLIGILLSTYFFVRSRRFQQPAVSKNSLQWFDGRQIPHKDVQLVFRGTTVERFTITHLVFWNAGNLPIRWGDFAATSPLRVSISKGTTVFDISLTGTTSPELAVHLGEECILANDGESAIPITFSFLDPNSGFSLQVIHDGKSDTGIDIKGKLPGVSEFKRSSFVTPSNRVALRFLRRPVGGQRAFRFVATAYSLIFGSLGLAAVYKAVFEDFNWIAVPGGFLSLLLLVPFLFVGQVYPPKALVEALTAQVPSEDK